MRGSAESQARMIGFHAKSVFIIGSYVITRETVWQATLNQLIRLISTLHIIMNVLVYYMGIQYSVAVVLFHDK